MTKLIVNLGSFRFLSLLTLTAVVFGIGFREDRFSCHRCRSLKELKTDSFLSVPIRQREVLSFRGNIGLNHAHDWWRYSRYDSKGLGGWLAKSVACKTNGRYRDDPAAR